MAEAPDSVRSQARAVLGSLNWLVRELRADGSGKCSLLQQALLRLTFEDVEEINALVEYMRATPKIGTHLWSIPLDRLTWTSVSDASLGNSEQNGSQGAFMIAAAELQISKGEIARASMISWKSSRMHRMVGSTLHAETLALNAGVSELGWVMTMMHEFAFSSFRLDLWEHWCENRRKLMLASAGHDDRAGHAWLRKGLSIVDAKSLYDYLRTETTGGRDPRFSTHFQIIRQAMNAIGCDIRWVDHQAMIIDGVMKRMAKAELLTRVMKDGTMKIMAEADTLVQHQEVHAPGKRLPR